MTQSRAYHKRLQHARQKRAQQAKQRRLQQQRERLQREQARAQRALQALEHAMQELGLPETVAEDVQWRLQAQQKLLGKIVGMMFPPGVRLSQLS
jgi:transcription initiation factor TFIIIB Brf1 subunit/transcription initiation factor TFIIB